VRRACDAYQRRRLLTHLDAALLNGSVFAKHPDAELLDALDVYMFGVGIGFERRLARDEMRPTNRAQRRAEARRSRRRNRTAHRQR
jgi:hypothetical protein